MIAFEQEVFYWSIPIYWEFEDQLSSDLPDKEYDAMFTASRVRDGVRMFPYIQMWMGHDQIPVRLYLRESEHAVPPRTPTGRKL